MRLMVDGTILWWYVCSPSLPTVVTKYLWLIGQHKAPPSKLVWKSGPNYVAYAKKTADKPSLI